jgi:hypothetical protein
MPLPPRDALRLAEDRAQTLHEAWPRELRLRSATAIRLRRLAAWLDPPPRRARSSIRAMHLR